MLIDTQWNENSKKLTYKVLTRQTNDSNPFHSNGVLKIKFIKNNGFETKVFNKSKSLIHRDNYTETFANKCYVKLIMECVSLWKNKSNIFTLYIRPHQVRVDYGFPPVNALTNYSFIDETEDNLDNKHNQNAINDIDSYSIESDSIESDSIESDSIESDSVNCLKSEDNKNNDSINSDSLKKFHDKMMESVSTDDSLINQIKSNNINKFKPVPLTELKNQESFKYNSDDLFALSTQFNSHNSYDKRTDTNMIQDAMQHIHDNNLNSSSEFSNNSHNSHSSHTTNNFV